jgi:hypothetical protein
MVIAHTDGENGQQGNWQAATAEARDVDMSGFFNFSGKSASIPMASASVAPSLADPVVGADIMVATPDAVGTQLERAELQLAQENGRTSHTEQDIERMTLAVEARVKQMMATGASDKEILAAVGSLPGVTPELQQLAQQVAEQQLAPDQFNIFSTRNQEEGQARDENPLQMLQALASGAAFSAAANNAEQENPRDALKAAFDAPMGDMFKDKPAEQAQDGQKSFAELVAGVAVSKELISMNEGRDASVAAELQPAAQLANLAQQRSQETGVLGA